MPMPDRAGESRGEDTALPLELRGVGYAVRGSALLEDLCCTIRAGRPTVILGPNGAGKTLMLRICHGLLAPSAGCVVWTGAGASAAGHRQAMVFQRPVLLRRSVAANLDYALRLRGLAPAERRSRSAEALTRTGLTPFATRAARRLSGGEQQRLALARAWAVHPEVLFLDEPTASLDPGATTSVETTVRAIAESGTKVVMTTHDLGQARRLAGDVVFLHRGRLVEHSDADEFFDAPASEPGRAFLKGDLFW